jgi:hypothetical protein
LFEPVVAKLLVLAFNELVYDSKAPTLPLKEDVAVLIEALNEFSDAVNAVNDAVCAANELVNVNTVESSPSNRSALEAYDAEAIEPEIVMLPEVMMLPVTVSEPEIMGELSIIFYNVLFAIKA